MKGRQTADGIDQIAQQWQAQGIGGDLVSMRLMGRLLHLAKIVESALSRCHTDFGLGQGEFDVLATLRRSGAPHCLTPSQLYQSMLLSSGAMTNRLDRLERKGLIERRHSEEDRRSVQVSLSADGLGLIERVLPEHMRTLEELLDGVDGQQRGELEQMLKLWLERLST